MSLQACIELAEKYLMYYQEEYPGDNTLMEVVESARIVNMDANEDTRDLAKKAWEKSDAVYAKLANYIFPTSNVYALIAAVCTCAGKAASTGNVEVYLEAARGYAQRIRI